MRYCAYWKGEEKLISPIEGFFGGHLLIGTEKRRLWNNLYNSGYVLSIKFVPKTELNV